MKSVQIFGVKNSQATRAAERFFKERSVAIHFVDLKQKPMSPGEIKRFVDRYGLPALLDTGSKAYVDGGLQYLRLTDADLLRRIEQEPRLLRLPLIRAANLLGVGQDEDAWKAMIAS
ncbi:MAG TPA: ArsC/Spx/MgsR family protein [Bryobacteraceae bacterium]|jgi:arsenate reductase-like glutaredoxin family protein